MTEPLDLDEEINLEEIRGQDRKPKMTVLNQKKVSRWEMDELFADDEYEEEF